MESIRCRNCHLVNTSTHAKCRRCGIELAAKTVKGPKQPTGGYSLPVKVVIAGAVAFVAYSYFGGESAAPPSNPAQANHAAAQPKPTLSLRSDYEQQQKTSYKTAIHSSSGLAQSQKRLEETQKLMQTEPAKQTK